MNAGERGAISPRSALRAEKMDSNQDPELLKSKLLKPNTLAAIDGGRWYKWSKCSATCGFGGSQVRRRKCDHPTPAFEGRPCEGVSGNKRSCFIAFCPIDGNWGPWSVWSFGNATCGFGGTKSRTRECDENLATEIQWSIQKLNFHGGWSGWLEWSSCIANCGQGGLMTKKRFCDSPAPEHGGSTDGGWSAWSEWLAPSLTSGEEATTSRSRSCSEPSPAFSGKPCQGESTDTRKAAVPPCPISGAWGEWADHSACGVACGDGGLQFRKRACDNPPPPFEGSYCPAVFGRWSSWSEWGKASASCGPAIVSISRKCNSPSLVHNGAVDEGWTIWGQWSPCSTTCAEGTSTRKRTCQNPSTAHGGRPCEGDDTESKTCNLRSCGGIKYLSSPMDGNYCNLNVDRCRWELE